MIKNLQLHTNHCFISDLHTCSDNPTGPGDLGLSQREGTFTVSGAINAEHEGEAWYTIDRSDDGTVFQIFASDVEFSIDSQANDDVSFPLLLIQAVWQKLNLNLQRQTLMGAAVLPFLTG